MKLKTRLSFKSKLLYFVLIFAAFACNLPAGTVEDLAEGLASIDFFVATSGVDTNDCQTRETACRSLTRAIAVVNGLPENPLTIIHIAPGTYDEIYDLQIIKSMNLIGDEGVIVNLLPTPGVSDSTSSFFVNPPAEATVRFEGLSIQGGDIGIIVQGGRFELNRVVMRNSMTNAVYSNNVVANILIQNSEFLNIGNAPIVTRGAGVSVTLRATDIYNNRGTAIMNYGSTFILDGVRIFNNNAANNSVSAIFNSFEGANRDSSLGNVSISSSAIYENTSIGGVEASVAILNEGGLLEVLNSTISSNSGTGIHNAHFDAETRLTHVTVVNHPAIGINGGSNTVRLVNSLVVYNGRDCEMRTFGAAPRSEGDRSENNIDSDNTCIDFNATERAAWDFYPGVDSVLSGEGVHRLETDSPAVDAVDCILPADQRGVARPQGLRCDVGAYELEPTLGEPPLVPTSTPLALIQVTATVGATLPAVPTQVASPATPSSAFVRVHTDANCRFGPDTVYSVITSFKKGTELPVEGRNANNTWWRIPIGGGQNCWISASLVETFGPVTSLPVAPAPPTPVPTSTSQASNPTAPVQLFYENVVCNGQVYNIPLRWTDTANNEQGFRVYRNGSLVTTLGPNSTQYTDSPPYGGPYTYAVEAYNAAGTSAQATITEPGCIP